MGILHAKSISGAPVLDPRGRLVGIASKADLADPRGRDVGEAAGLTRAVKDVMTRVVYAVRADDSVLNAVRLMIAEDIHRAIVVTPSCVTRRPAPTTTPSSSDIRSACSHAGVHV